MQRLLRKYLEFAAGTRVLLLSFLGVLVMMLLVFPALPVNGELIDLKMSYTLTDIQAAMAQYGPDGRAVYALASSTVDTLFPLLYVTFFAGMLYRFRPQERLWVLAIIPVFAGVWDLSENAQIITMLLQYPDISERQVGVASFFTSVKHLLSGLYEVVTVVFLAIFLRSGDRK